MFCGGVCSATEANALAGTRWKWRGQAGHGRVDGDVFGTVVSRDIIGMRWYSKTRLGTCCKRRPSLNILTVQARSLAALVG